MKTERLKAVVQNNPENPDLFRNLGRSHFEDGSLGESLAAFLMALALDPQNFENRRNALKLLGMTSGYQVPGQLRAVLTECAADPDLDTQALASVIHGEFATGSVADLLTEDLQQGQHDKVLGDLSSNNYDAILQDNLLKAVLVNAVLVTPALERLLTELRKFFLERLVECEGEPDETLLKHADFIAAMACQCFNTEYIYALSNYELEVVERLMASVDDRTDLVSLSILACYVHIHDNQAIRALTSVLDKTDLMPCQSRMITRLVIEPVIEEQLAADVRVLAEIADTTSLAVQAQYERFPYPRWTSAEQGDKPVRFGKYVRQRFPLVRAKQVSDGRTDILVAGCGTGKQVIELAGTYKNTAIVAVDLSCASLAYAQAQAHKRALDNITFIQSDILQLGALDTKFDLIECMGVLHHMAEPENGLAVLKGLLKPNGFMRLALYSYRARPEVMAAASHIKEHGLDGSVASLRAFRQQVYDMPVTSRMAKLTRTRDFFSMSGLHDYVFNVQERTFTPLELREFLMEGGLEFLGFDMPTVEAETAFRRTNPSDRFMSDLEAWDRYEATAPDTFGAMFQFWCRPGRKGPH